MLLPACCMCMNLGSASTNGSLYFSSPILKYLVSSSSTVLEWQKTSGLE